ncbi:uncharacterized protein DS421_3g74450 [Arachis hypogaea]|nr:uncharacterized protein DS421_3g74450 [Arachis hypogaea]
MDFFSFTNIFSLFFWSLQKYRLGNSQPQLEICSGNNKHEDCREMNNSEGPCSSREESIGTENEMTETYLLVKLYYSTSFRALGFGSGRLVQLALVLVLAKVHLGFKSLAYNAML